MLRFKAPEAFPLALLGGPFTLVGEPLALVGKLLTVVGDSVALLRDSVALIGDPLPPGDRMLPLLERPLMLIAQSDAFLLQLRIECLELLAPPRDVRAAALDLSPRGLGWLLKHVLTQPLEVGSIRRY
jgi:hypothetical protein